MLQRGSLCAQLGPDVRFVRHTHSRGLVSRAQRTEATVLLLLGYRRELSYARALRKKDSREKF